MVGGQRGEFVSYFTPLMMAAHMGRLDLIEALLKHGADPKLKESKGRNLINYIRVGKNPDIEEAAISLANKHCGCKLGAE